MHRLSNPPRLRKLQTTIDELSSIPPGGNCSEPCLGPLLAVIEQSRLHSTIVLMTSVPPSDADQFALVMDLARLKDIKIHFILSKPLCGGDLQIHVDLAQHTGGAVLTSFSKFVDFFTFQQSSGISVSPVHLILVYNKTVFLCSVTIFCLFVCLCSGWYVQYYMPYNIVYTYMYVRIYVYLVYVTITQQ